MVGDEAELYRSLAPRVEQLVRRRVRAPREVIEDACHHAWAKLINHSERVDRDAVLSWLTTAAVREAWKLDRRERRELSLEGATERLGELTVPTSLPGPEERIEYRDVLRQVAMLSERQQQLVWLRALGLSYVEMSAYTGDTVRTVERQVLRATDRMRQEQARRSACARAESMRASGHMARRAPERDERGVER